MARPPAFRRDPSYRLHKQSGQAVVTLPQFDGTRTIRKDKLLGQYGSIESRRKYQEEIAEWRKRNHRQELLPPRHGMTVAELWLRFWEGRIIPRYRNPDGSPTSEQHNYRDAGMAFRSLYEDLDANDVDADKLETWLIAVTRPMRVVIDTATGADRQFRGWCRNVANKHLSRIKAMFRYGKKRGWIRPDVFAMIEEAEGLLKGRCDARETEPVEEVAEAHVEAIRPFVSAQVWAILDLLMHSGARPGELCRMRTAEINTRPTARGNWLFTPRRHKNQWRGHNRKIALGKHCQEILRPLLRPDLEAFIFRPEEAESARRQAAHAARKTPIGQGNSVGTNRKRVPRWKPGDCYTVDSLRRAVQRACDRAFPPPAPLGRAEGESVKQWQARLTSEQKQQLTAWRKEHRFHPHQARHAALTRARESAGLDGAQAFGGHKHAQVTEIYAGKLEALADEVAAKIG